MLPYFLKCKKNTESINPKVSATSNGRTITLSKCAICRSRKSKFIKKQEAKGLLSNLGIRAPLSKIPLLGDFEHNSLNYKTNDIINKFLLVADKVMPEMNLRQPGFTYSACGTFTKSKERMQKFKKAGDSRYVYKNESDKACFQHDMVYGDFKDLKKRTAADKGLRDKAFNIAKNLKYDGYQRELPSMFYKFFDKKTKGSGVTLANKSATKSIPQTEQLAEGLYKPIIRTFKKRKVYSAFKDNIWAANLADMPLISKFNKGFKFLLCIIDIYSKYAWFLPLKDKKGVSIVNAFQSILKKSNRKPNKIWVDKGGEFYNRSMKSWLEKNDIEMYLTHNEGKSVVTERFIRTIKNKIYKYIRSISKNVYIDRLDNIAHKCDNRKHKTI